MARVCVHVTYVYYYRAAPGKTLKAAACASSPWLAGSDVKEYQRRVREADQHRGKGAPAAGAASLGAVVSSPRRR